MENNKKLLKAGIGLIAVLVVLGYIGVYLLYLDEPVFVEHYIEERVYTSQEDGPREVDLELYYITNAGDQRVVNRVEFPEYPEIEVPASEYGMSGGLAMFSPEARPPGEVKGRYSMRRVFLKFSLGEDYREEGPLEITEAVIHFSDGSTLETEIGSLHFHVDQERGQVLESRGTRGSGSMERRTISVHQDIELMGVESPLLGKVPEDLEISINDVDYREIEGINIEAGEELLVESNTQGSGPFHQDLRYWKIRPKLRFTTDQGEEGLETLLVAWYPTRNYEFMDILRYLQQKGAI